MAFPMYKPSPPPPPSPLSPPPPPQPYPKDQAELLAKKLFDSEKDRDDLRRQLDEFYNQDLVHHRAIKKMIDDRNRAWYKSEETKTRLDQLETDSKAAAAEIAELKAALEQARYNLRASKTAEKKAKRGKNAAYCGLASLRALVGTMRTEIEAHLATIRTLRRGSAKRRTPPTAPPPPYD